MEFKFPWDKKKAAKAPEEGVIKSRRDELNAIIDDSFRVKPPSQPTMPDKKKKK